MATTNKSNSKDSSNSKNKESSSSTSSSTKDKISTSATKNKENQSNAANTENEQDKYKKFEEEGVVFKAKLIGSELVMEPRGDKMCQNSIQRLKAIIKGTNSHKKRIVLKISYDGVKVFDEKTNEILHHHEVSQISYIASDDTDSRTFGYVSDVPNKAHQFICFKTSGPAINVMSVISALFEAVLEKKNQAEKEKQQSTEGIINITKQEQQDSIDLIGDSGIIDGDSSFASIDKITPNQSHLPLQQSNSSAIFENHLTSPGTSFNSNSNNNRSKQSASTDLLFDDLFAGLSDPIIVDKNDSLISYKQQNKDSGAKGAIGGVMSSAPVNFYPPRQPGALHSSASANMVPSSTASTTNAHPIPQRQHSLQQQHPPLLPPPSSLPMHHHAIMMANNSSSGPGVSMGGNILQKSHNRSLVYNHSSLSLSDAPALTSRTPFNSTSSSAQNQNDSYVDRYAVFNDIDNLPSIFESASLGSVNNVGAAVTSGKNSNNMSQASIHEQQYGSRGYNNNQNMSMLNSAGNSFSQSFTQNYLQQSSSSGFGGSVTGVHNFNNALSSMNPGGPTMGGALDGVSGIRGAGRAGVAGGLGRSTSTTAAPDVDIFRQNNPFDDDFFA